MAVAADSQSVARRLEKAKAALADITDNARREVVEADEVAHVETLIGKVLLTRASAATLTSAALRPQTRQPWSPATTST